MKSYKKIKNKIKNLRPDFTFKKVEDIPINFLIDNHIKLIMFDMDNTLVNYKYAHTDKLKEWIKKAKEQNIKLYILTNCKNEEKVKKVSKKLGIKYIHHASKPRRKGFEDIIKEENVEKKYVLMIGDQIFTDVFGGNNVGVNTVLVEPIDSKEKVVSKVKRPFEKLLKKFFFKERKAN